MGKVGVDCSVDDAKEAAKRCALGLLSTLHSVADLDHIRILKVNGMVNTVDSFTNHPEVINGASDLFVAVLGDNGRHARAAVGMASLPRGVAVEIDLVAVEETK